MSNDAFTLDMFGEVKLSAGFGLGFAASGSVEPVANDDDPEPTPPSPAPALPARSEPPCVRANQKPANFYLEGDRGLARGWKERARDNIAAVALASEIEVDERPATRAEQERLIRFTGFGASELANGVFRRPGDVDFRKGWVEIGTDLQDAVGEADYASLARCTQYAHFTPEFIVRAIWSGLERLGWRGGRILEPGIGTGLFPALMPDALRDRSHVTGIELDPVTARIARLLQPRARIVTGDFASTELPASFDLAIGNPPFSDRTVRSDRAYRSLGLRLHDYFIARSIDLLKPGALATFVTSTGTMDKADATCREHIAKSADLIAAIRLPEGSFRSEAGTDVVVDILFFRKCKAGEIEGDPSWLDTEEVRPATAEEGAIKSIAGLRSIRTLCSVPMRSPPGPSARPIHACRMRAWTSTPPCRSRSIAFRKPFTMASRPGSMSIWRMLATMVLLICPRIAMCARAASSSTMLEVRCR